MDDLIVKDCMIEIISHIKRIIIELDSKEADVMVKAITDSNRVFVMGAGRSGLAARAFAMRLVQLGIVAYVIGEVVTPSMDKNDLFLAVSGSGSTTTVVNAAKTAKSIGSKVLAVTSYPESELGHIADYVVVIKGKTKKDIEIDYIAHQIQGKHTSLTPLGTLFEDTVMIFFEGVIAELMKRLKKSAEDLKIRHANIE